MINHARVAINNVTPTIVTPYNPEDIGFNAISCTVQIQNIGNDPVYIGGADLTSTSYGVTLVPGSAFAMDDLPPQDEIYVLGTAANGYVAVLRMFR